MVRPDGCYFVFEGETVFDTLADKVVLKLLVDKEGAEAEDGSDHGNGAKGERDLADAFESRLLGGQKPTDDTKNEESEPGENKRAPEFAREERPRGSLRPVEFGIQFQNVRIARLASFVLRTSKGT